MVVPPQRLKQLRFISSANLTTPPWVVLTVSYTHLDVYKRQVHTLLFEAENQTQQCSGHNTSPQCREKPLSPKNELDATTHAIFAGTPAKPPTSSPETPTKAILSLETPKHK